jgi:hypothetical protein
MPSLLLGDGDVVLISGPKLGAGLFRPSSSSVNLVSRSCSLADAASKPDNRSTMEGVIMRRGLGESGGLGMLAYFIRSMVVCRMYV